MKLHTALLLSLLATVSLPAAAADAKTAAAPAPAASAAADAKAAPADAAKAKALSPKERKAECEKQSKGKTGVERKKFMRDCMAGKTEEATAAKPADAKPAEAKAADVAAKPAEGEKKAPPPPHKAAFPKDKVENNPRLLERSCMMDANERGLTGKERIDYLKDCVKDAKPQHNTFVGK